MAAELGERLLGEVREERLDELLHDLRTIHEHVANSGPLSHRLGVTEIDDLLDVFMQGPVQPMQEHLVPTEEADLLEGDDDGEYAHEYEHEDDDEHQVEDSSPVNLPDWQDIPKTRVRRKPVLEISSTSSAAGKSQMLCYLAANAVLPALFAGRQLGGHESAVVFIDTDGRLEADRIRTIARGIVHERLCDPSEPDTLPNPELESMLSSSLQHIHVFRPESSSSLLATLQSLSTYLYELHRHLSSSRPLHSIFIDSAGAFFWQDKLHDEVARTEDIGRPHADVEHERAQKESFYLGDLYAELVVELKRLQTVFGCAVTYTTVASSGRSMAGTGSDSNQQNGYRPSGPFELYNPLDELASRPRGPAFRSPLPPPWGVFPDLRLVVQRDRVKGFPDSMSAEKAQEQAVLRREVVLKGRFLVWVNAWGREDWPRRVHEGLERRNGGMFGFRATREGVWFT